MNSFVHKYDAAVPRYTSYPTAPHFSANLGNEDYTAWLKELDPLLPISLYLHVPYCREMCWYCGCHTKITQKNSPISDYAEALRCEIRLLAEVLPSRFSVSHLHWGGGTPSILAADDFTSIMALIGEKFDFTKNAEKAIEIDPRTVDEQKIEALAKSGINRASLGVQDFNPIVQAAINRIQSFEITQNTVDLLRKYGLSSINFDLMYGLPFQTTEDVRKSVELSHSLAPDRVALFGYAHVPWMKSHMKLIRDADLPGTEGRFDQAKTAAEELVKCGYQQIGLDHFALSSDTMSTALDAQALHRNFQGYTTDASETLIGIGASSIGNMPRGYAQNVVSIHDYMRKVRSHTFAIAKGISMTTDDKMRRDVIERLMCDLSVNLEEITKRYGQSDAYFEEELHRLSLFQEDGLVKLEGPVIQVNEEGRLLVRTICAVFDIYLDTGTGRHSRAV